MPESVLSSQSNQDRPNQLNFTQKSYILIILVIIIVIANLPILIGRVVLVDTGISENDWMLFVVLPYLSLILMLICPYLAVRIKPHLVAFDIKWFRKTRSEVKWIFLLPLIVFIVVLPIHYLIRQSGILTDKNILFFNTHITFLIAYTFLLVVAGPIIEEIFWRGYAQDQLGKVFGPRIALFVQAVAFAVLHFRPVGGSFIVFIHGIIYGFWRYRRKTLLPIIISHIIFNSIVCIGRWDNWIELRKIDIKTNYVEKFNEISKPENYVPNDNAAGYYEEVFEAYSELPESLSKSDIKAWPGDLSEEKLILLQEWGLANSEALEKLELGSQKPYYWLEYQESSMFAASFPSPKVKRPVDLICTSAKLNALKGDFKKAFSDILVCYRYGQHFAGRKGLIEQLIGISISTMSVESAFQILDKTNPNADLLGDFKQRLQVLLAMKSYIIDFTAWKFIAYDGIQMTFTDDEKGGGYVPKAAAKQIENPPDSLKFLFSDLTVKQRTDWEKMDRRQTTELADKVFRYLNWARYKTPAHFHREGKDLEKVIEEMIKDNPFMNTIASSNADIIYLSYRIKIHTDALITTLALLKYRAEKGMFPKKLDQLISSGYLIELPMDPYSDGPLVYESIGDNFTLYSLGADFDDDGGVPSNWGRGEDGGDQVFWPVKKTKD